MKSLSLKTLQERNRDCVFCNLRDCCNQVVTGNGNTNARLFIVGERPDSEDDLMGEPFSARSGTFFIKLLEQAGFSKDEIYFTYLLKCKNNEKNIKDFVNVCKRWIWDELRIINPSVVITLGKLPTTYLLKLKSSTKLKDVVGVTHAVGYMQAEIIPWYDPDYLLQRGVKSDKETIALFAKIKERINELEKSRTETELGS